LKNCKDRRWRKRTGLVLVAVALLASLSAGATEPPLSDVIGFQPTEGAEAYFHFAMGKMAQRQNRLDLAITFLKEAATADPTSATIQAELAWTYLTVRDYPAAEEAARAALEIEPHHSMAHTVLAQLYYSRARRGIEPEKNRRQAMLELEASLTGSDEDDPDILLSLGRFYFEVGDYEKAAARLEAFVDANPNPPPTPLFLLARAQIHLERYPEAEASLARVLAIAPDSIQALETLVNVKRLKEDYESSIPLLQRILAIQGGDASTYRKLGDAYYRTAQYPEAVEMFEMARREEPYSPYTLYYLALSQERLGHLEEARETFLEMLRRDEENAEVLFRLARLEERQGDLEAAVGHYRGLITALEQVEDPDDPRRRDVPTFCARVAALLMELARNGEAVKELNQCRERLEVHSALLDIILVRALVFAGKEERALGEVRRAMRTFPDDERMSVLEGEVLLHMGRDEEGEALLAALLEEAAADEEAGQAVDEGGEPTGASINLMVADAFFNAGARAERGGEIERAETFLEKAIEIHPDHSAALNHLGYTWADADRNLQEALLLLKRAVALDPDNGAYQDSLGWVYYRLGRNDEARVHLLRAIQLLSRDATIHDHLGDVEAAGGNLSGAEKHWRRALELGADDPGEIERKLRRIGNSAKGE
jgi:tetratricopeptide (TPR) repeat protein